MNGKKLTTEEFISKARFVHSNKFNYSLVCYKNSKEKVNIICPIHGIFEQSPNLHLSQKRGCPTCGKLLGIEKNTPHLKTNWIGKKHKISTRNKMRMSQRGDKHPLYGKKHSNETRHKIRVGCIKALRDKGIFPGSGMVKTYNPKACLFIDKLNEMIGLNLQHALNGGEVELYGYFADGYDKKKNIIFEYDEYRHYDINGNLLSKDISRQNDLIQNINPSLFLRFDEKNNRLYDAQTNADIQVLVETILEKEIKI
jgi:hypothetical protein